MPPINSLGLPTLPVGQIIFDINGEYANANLQDEGTAIAEIYENETVRYSCIEKPGFVSMKINFYHELSSGFYWIKKSMKEGNQAADYIRVFESIDFNMVPEERGAKVTYDRVVAAYQCCLYKAGFDPPDNFRIRFQGKTEFNTIKTGGVSKTIDPRYGISLDQAVEWFENYWSSGGSVTKKRPRGGFNSFNQSKDAQRQ